MKDIVEEIMNEMDQISYGYLIEEGFNLADNPERWEKEIYSSYHLTSPKELMEIRVGTCFEQTEMERMLFENKGIDVDTYFMCSYGEKDSLPSHSFLTYKYNNKYYWFEHSWGKYKGIHEYYSIKELLLDVKRLHNEENNVKDKFMTFVYKYEKPEYGISLEEYYKYMKTQKLIKLNKPLYFYHLVNKNANMSLGLLSLKYLYDNKMYSLFDKYASKYIDRITNDWNIEKYKGKKELSRKEIIDALNIFRGEEGASYIYFFRYAPYKELGKNMEDILKYKDIYRININDEELLLEIKDIFYGYSMSNSDNELLTRKYYENVSKNEYFSMYDDNNKMLFSTLNHIAISFNQCRCPVKYLQKIVNNFELINNENELLVYMDEFINYYFNGDFGKYSLQINDELLFTKRGNCFDQVELERYFFDKMKIPNKTYFISFLLDYSNNYTMHTFLLYIKNGKYYIFENADSLNKGIFEFDNINDALEYKKELFLSQNKEATLEEKSKIVIKEYSKPNKKCSFDEFITHILDN